ncbi:hypothetical protein EYF80_059499 [Liparis tanakae]|uniref:Uncharacterized protein n=1 Tax=Liparis tanakae TaxID=230148 RepID=A0A4Z2ENM6_9TELE|nr:hypothetical protein EYF80_059499 [Liparis tanakae]
MEPQQGQNMETQSSGLTDSGRFIHPSLGPKPRWSDSAPPPPRRGSEVEDVGPSAPDAASA